MLLTTALEEGLGGPRELVSGLSSLDVWVSLSQEAAEGLGICMRQKLFPIDKEVF